MAPASAGAVSGLRCSQRRPEGCWLEWTVTEPWVRRCEVQVLQGEWWQSWEAAKFEPDGQPHVTLPGSWKAKVAGLSPGTAYSIQVRGCGTDTSGPWLTIKDVRTSDRPAAPSVVKCVRRLADRLVLEWEVRDPEGAELTSCEAQTQGTFCWSAATFGKSSSPSRVSQSTWSAVIGDLQPNSLCTIQVRGKNVVGEGEWSMSYSFKTSEPPPAPSCLQCAKKMADRLQLEWQVPDPEGAEVSACEVQVSGSVSWSAAGFERALPSKSQDGRWQATVAGLAGATDYAFRIRGVNAAGEGAWAEMRCRTSEVPTAPSGLGCIARGADSLRLEWRVDDPDGAEVLGCDVWLAGSVSWQAASFVSGCEPRRDNPFGGELWHATVCGLSANTAYDLRVRGRNAVGLGAWSQESVKTSELPAEPFSIQCAQRRSNQLLLQWQLRDPEGAEVTGCEVQLAGSLSWASAALEAGSEPKRLGADRWQVCIVDLEGDSAYEVRIRGRNAGGDGVWARKSFKTSETPPEPKGLQCVRAKLSGWALQWEIEDPEGAEVQSCEVLVGGSVSWAAAAFDEEPKRLHGGVWQAGVCGLAGDTCYDLKVRGHSASGSGRWSQPQRFQTLGPPAAPADLRCARRLPDRLELEWEVSDPEGAEVQSCEVQQRGSLSWGPAALLDGLPPRRAQGGRTWRATVVDLAGASPYDFRVRGRNDVGDGRWSEQQQFKTSDTPSKPSDLQCLQRNADRLSLRWRAEDPAGAEVSRCEVQIGSSLSWSLAQLEPGKAPERESGSDVWRVVVVGLAGATAYDVRVRGCNASGDGQWSAVQQFKTSEAPSSPVDVRCVSRAPEQLSIEWRVADPEGAEVSSCEVQLLGSISWASADFAPEVAPRKADGGAWRATLVKLDGATAYALRVRGRNACGEGEWCKQLEVKTSDLPPQPIDLRCVQRLPDEVRLEWEVPDPEGAEILSCEVQVSGSLSWAAACLQDGGQATRKDGGTTWRAALVGLQGHTAYDVRVRGRNACGEGAWSQGQFKTSEMPGEPTELRCTQCQPEKLVLEWQVADPEGSKVVRCDIEVRGSVSWAAAQLEGGLEAVRGQGDVWTATLVGLAGASAYDIRVRGCNSAGGGPWAKKQFRTSSLPAAPSGLRCTRETPKRLALEWSCQSPEGAKITGCEVQISSSLVWETAALEEPPAEDGNNLWSATVVGLSHDTSFSVRVRGTNAVGAGAWCEPQKFATLGGKPETPTALQVEPQGQGLWGLTWQVADPEDMAVISCKVQVLVNPSIAAPYWDAAKFASGREPRRVTGQWWGATMSGVLPDTPYTLSVFASNAAGDGRWLRKDVRTLKLPAAASGLQCAEQLHDRLALEWKTTDPQGAPVTSCEVQVSGTFLWQAASLGGENGGTEASAVARRKEGTNSWRAVMVGLSPNTKYDVRVGPRNAVGDGPWTTAQFRTAAKPAAP